MLDIEKYNDAHLENNLHIGSIHKMVVDRLTISEEKKPIKISLSFLTIFLYHPYIIKKVIKNCVHSS